MKKKKVPKLKTDKAAEKFLAQDLSELDFSQFKAARFEFERKDEQINMRVPGPLLAAAQSPRQDTGYSLYPLHSRNAGAGHGVAEVLAVTPLFWRKRRPSRRRALSF